MELTQIGQHTPGRDPVLFSSALHTQTVHAIAVLPDGYSAVSTSEDETMLRWSIETGEILERIEGHEGPVNHLAVRGKWLASAGDDRTVRLWRADGRLHTHAVLEGHDHFVRQVALSDRHLVSVSNDQKVRVFDLEDGGLIHELEGHDNTVQCVAISPDGRFAVTASLEHTVHVWDLQTGQRVEPLYDAGGHVHNLGMGGLYFATKNQTGIGHVDQAPIHIEFLDDNQLITASDGMIEWNFAGRREIRSLADLAWSIQGVAVDHDRIFVATHTEVRGVSRGDWQEVVFRHAAPKRGAKGIAIAGDRLLVGGTTGEVMVFDVGAWMPEERHLSNALDATIAPGGEVAATIDHDNVVRLWNLRSASCQSTFDRHQEPNTKPFAFSPDGDLIATTRRDGSPAVSIHEVATGALKCSLDHQDDDGRPASVHSVLFAWDGVIVGPAGERSIQWWALDGERVHELQGATRQVSRLALCGHLLISVGFFPNEGSEESVSQLQAWNLWDRTLLWTRGAVKAPEDRFAPAFGPLTVLKDSTLLTGTGRTGEIAVYDVESGDIKDRWDLGASAVVASHQTPDGWLVAVTRHRDNKRVELVHLADGGSVAARCELPSGANRFSVAPDASRLAWAEGTDVVLADLDTGEEVARRTLEGDDTVSSIALRHDGARIVVGAASGRVRVFSVN